MQTFFGMSSLILKLIVCIEISILNKIENTNITYLSSLKSMFPVIKLGGVDGDISGI